MDFMNLAEVPEVDNVKDGDTVFVVRDGEVCRVAKDKIGGGAGGYVVNVAAGEIVADEDSNMLLITTPVPGLLEAAAGGAVVIIAVDIALLMGETEKIGANAYITTLGAADMGAIAGDEGAGYIISAIMVSGSCVNVVFTNGQPIPNQTSVTALRSKLGGGTNAVV